jgi:asparagine synthetase B (glutamine-hydrolysing)
MIYENEAISQTRYFDLERKGNAPADKAQCVEGIRHYLREAVRKQKISDVPLGVYLSGGLDSSALVRYMADFASEPVRTFSMGFNEPTDELGDARVIADQCKTEHHEISVSPDPLSRDFFFRDSRGATSRYVSAGSATTSFLRATSCTDTSIRQAASILRCPVRWNRGC